jgi:hypothetical protein
MKNSGLALISGPHKWLLTGAAGLLLFSFPSKTEKFAVRFISRGLTIQTARRDPPRIAFNELLAAEKKNNAEPVNQLQPSINLNESTDATVGLEPKTWIGVRKLALKPMVISHEVAMQEVESHNWVEDLPAEQKRRIAASQEKYQTLDSDWSVPSWKQLLSEQLVRVKQEVGQQPSVAGSRQVFISTTLPDGSAVTPQSHLTSDVQVDLQPPVEPAVHVAGKIRLQNGLALGDGYIDIRHVRNGVSQDIGHVNPQKGLFEADVPDYNGSLVASLRSKTGEVLGEGSLRLSQISPNRFGTAEIDLTPVQNSIAMQYVDFNHEVAGSGKNHYGDRGLAAATYFASLDSEKKADSSGQAKVGNVIKGSWSMVRSELTKYAPTMTMAEAGKEERRALLTKSFVTALKGIAQDLQKASLGPETGSIVWGQAKMDGKPISGIRLEAEFQDGYQVLYFNTMMLPDPQMNSTGENGYFAVLNLREGMHSLVATRGDNYFSHTNVVTEPEVVTLTDVTATAHVEPVEARVFDAFDGGAGVANLELQSLANNLIVNGITQVYLPLLDRYSLMRVEPQDTSYVPTSMVYTDTQDDLHIPLIRASWLQHLKASRRIGDEVNVSTIVGFVQDEAYDVYLPHVESYSRQNIVYFNSRGEIVEESVAGGGFVLFNVMPGTQSVVVVSKSSNMANSQVIPMDEDSVGVLHFHF